MRAGLCYILKEGGEVFLRSSTTVLPFSDSLLTIPFLLL